MSGGDYIELPLNQNFWTGLYTVLEGLEEVVGPEHLLSEVADGMANNVNTTSELKLGEPEILMREIADLIPMLSLEKSLTALLPGSDLEDPLKAAYMLRSFHGNQVDFRYNPDLLIVELKVHNSFDGWIPAKVQMAGQDPDKGGIYVNRESQSSLFKGSLEEISLMLDNAIQRSSERTVNVDSIYAPTMKPSIFALLFLGAKRANVPDQRVSRFREDATYLSQLVVTALCEHKYLPEAQN